MSAILALFSGPYAALARLVCYVALALGIAAGGAYAMHHYVDQPKIDGLNQQLGAYKADLATANASVNALKAAIATQNAAIAAVKTDGDKRMATAQAALQTAQAIIATLQHQKAAADAYQRPAGVEACTAAQSIIDGDNNAP